MENQVRKPTIPEDIMDILRNLMNRGHRKDALKTHLSTLIHPQNFLSPPVIQYSSRIYQWFRDILESAEVNTKLPEYHQETDVFIHIIREV